VGKTYTSFLRRELRAAFTQYYKLPQRLVSYHLCCRGRAIGSALYRGLSLLQAQGFLRVMEVSEDFRLYLLTLTSTRPLVAQYDKKINYVDVQNNRMKENMITLGNTKYALYVMLVLIASACVSFAAEVFSKLIVFMMLTKVETF